MEKTKKKKTIIAVCVCAFVVLVACLVALLACKKSIVFETISGPNQYRVVAKGKSLSFESRTKYGHMDIDFQYSGTYTDTSSDGYKIFQLTDAKETHKAFGLETLDETHDITTNEKIGLFMNDKVAYNILADEFTLKQGVVAEDDDVLAIMSAIRMYYMTDYDLFVLKDTNLDDVKNDIHEAMLVVYGNANYDNLIGAASSIVSIKHNGADFNTSTAGTYNVVVTYDTDKTLDISIKVGEEADDPNNHIVIPTIGDTLYLEVGTTFEDAFAGKKIQINYEAGYDDLTRDMLSSFDTSKEGITYVTVTYKNYTRNLTIKVYDPTNIKTVNIYLENDYFTVKKGENFEFEFEVKKNNASSASGGYDHNTEGVVVSGFDTNKLGPQLVTITYDGITEKTVVYVYDSTNNIVDGVDSVDNVEINAAGEIVGEPKFTIIKMDGTTEAVAITKEMLDSKALESKKDSYYFISYVVDGVTLYEEAYYTFTE